MLIELLAWRVISIWELKGERWIASISPRHKALCDFPNRFCANSRDRRDVRDFCRWTENRQLLRFLFQLPNPLLQELPLGFLLGQRQSFLIRGPGLGCPAKPAVHIRTG